MKNKTFVILTTIFASTTIIFLCFFLSFLATTNTYKTALKNTYQKSFYEMVSAVNSLEVDMSKLVATTSIDSQRELLGNIYQSAGKGVSVVNTLPIGLENLLNLNKLLNTTSGFAYSLLLANFDGSTISNDDYSQIVSIHSRIKEIQYDLRAYMNSRDFDDNIIDNVDLSSVDDNNYTAGIAGTESSMTKVPSLIYDGPFSDSVLNKEIVGLEDRLYSREEAEEKLSLVYPGVGIEYTGETLGKFETYNFEITGDYSLYVSVTKKGCFILSVTSFTSGEGDKNLSVDEGVELAQTYASDIGLSNMYQVWKQKVGNTLYVNLAPIVNRVIYYSDLVKVKVDLSRGIVSGYEASNYATNHRTREFNSSISLLDAEVSVSDVLNIVERNLCIIPDKFVGEINAYEYICTWDDYVYYIYIDSDTGAEVNILRVIDTDSGELLK